jgi:hypothetical protein
LIASAEVKDSPGIEIGSPPGASLRSNVNPLILVGFLSACTTTTESGLRARSDLAQRLPEIRTAGLVSLDVKEYEVSAGGVTDLKDAWSTAARANVQRALITGFRSRQIELQPIDPGPDTAEEVNDLRLLSEAINASMSNYPLKTFDYSLGSVGPLLDRYGVDALVFAWARGRLMTGGRKFLSGLFGSGEADVGLVGVIMVDRSGNILWFNSRGLRGNRADLRYADSATSLLQAIIGDLPPAKP